MTEDHQTWFQGEFEKTDLGLLSVITWIVIMLFAGFLVGSKNSIGLKTHDWTTFASGILLWRL